MRAFIITLIVALSLCNVAVAQNSNQIDATNNVITSDISAAFNLTDKINFTPLSQAEKKLGRTKLTN